MHPTFATLILTRPREAAQRFLDGMGDLPEGLATVISPLVDIVPTGITPDYSDYEGVIFTSANGVRFAGPAAGIPAWCVGPETTARAKAAGWNATQAGATADELYKCLIRRDVPFPLLHVGGVHRRGNLAQRLTRAELTTDEADVYDQPLRGLTKAAKEALSGTNPVIVPLFSPRAARHFAAQDRGGAPLHLVALSEAVLAEARFDDAETCSISNAPDAGSMRAKLLEMIGWLETQARAQ